MNRLFAAGATIAVLLLASSSMTADDASLKSGPQVGENGRPAPFNVLNVNNGKAKNTQALAGKSTCAV